MSAPDEYLKLVLTRFRLEVSIGVHEFEKARAQEVAISLELYLDRPAHRGADELEATLDYDFVRDEIRSLVRGRHYALQEKLCEDIIALCWRKPQVTAVRVKTEKTEVYADCDSVGVEIFRRRK